MLKPKRFVDQSAESSFASISKSCLFIFDTRFSVLFKTESSILLKAVSFSLFKSAGLVVHAVLLLALAEQNNWIKSVLLLIKNSTLSHAQSRKFHKTNINFKLIYLALVAVNALRYSAIGIICDERNATTNSTKDISLFSPCKDQRAVLELATSSPTWNGICIVQIVPFSLRSSNVSLAFSIGAILKTIVIAMISLA